MTRYRYNRQFATPAPFVYLTIKGPQSEEPGLELAAQIDTGADRSVVPAQFVEKLGLVEVRAIPILGFGGHQILVSTYLAEVAIRGFPGRLIEILANDQESYCLLGRDILNHHRVTLDGPNLSVVIE